MRQSKGRNIFGVAALQIDKLGSSTEAIRSTAAKLLVALAKTTSKTFVLNKLAGAWSKKNIRFRVNLMSCSAMVAAEIELSQLERYTYILEPLCNQLTEQSRQVNSDHTASI